MLHRRSLAALAAVCALALPTVARAVNLVNDTWKDGTDSDPTFGDANFDDVGGVNGQDYLIWQGNFGLAGATNATGDANTDTNVNATDLAVWTQQYGGLNVGPVGYSENGVDADGDGDIESAWYQGGTGALNPAGVNGPLLGSTHNPADGEVLSTGSSSWTSYFKPAGEKVILANPGDALKVTWAFKLTNVNASNGSQAFRFGVVDAGARVTAANGSPPSAIYAGYAIWGNMGQTTSASGSFQLRERTLATSGNLLNTTGDFGGVLGNGAGSGLTGYVANTTYTMTWLMTRGATDNLLLDVKMAGGSLGNDVAMTDTDGIIQVMFDDATPNTFQFDTFALRPSQEAQTATEFLASLFKVEFLPASPAGAVPEPTSLVCGLLAVVGLASLRRRR